MPLPTSPISPFFTTRKQSILAALSAPPASYTDLSPKGSVDTGIADLIAEINAIDGLVTTSSCAGRISVFLEGRKDSGQGDDGPEAGSAVPGGKGLGGRWLFVSHDPVEVPAGKGEVGGMFGLRAETPSGGGEGGVGRRLVRFQFEPMILHIQTASLQHASRVLAAGLNAGFRESGLQSLKALEDPHAFPMVAIRTAGLSLSSVVGSVDDSKTRSEFGSDCQPISLVSEEYLAMMLQLGNERFVENTNRIERFRKELQKAVAPKSANGEGGNGEWEEKGARAERMKREGLARRQAQQERRSALADEVQIETSADEIGGGILLPED